MRRYARLAGVIAGLLSAGAARGQLLKPDGAAVKRAPSPFPYAEWDALLKRYADGSGRVDYAALKADAAGAGELERLFAAVAASSPKSAPDQYPTKAARAAYYLDAYNVLVWKNVLAKTPDLKSKAGQYAFFYQAEFLVGGKAMNLYRFENEVIRPELKDARVHMALNCASGGCPQLPREAFTPAKLDDQLTREARKFVGEKRNVDWNPTTKTVRLSHIFDWYKEDFGDVLAWINKYREPSNQIPADAKLEFVDYDWTLNDPKLKR